VSVCLILGSFAAASSTDCIEKFFDELPILMKQVPSQPGEELLYAMGGGWVANPESLMANPHLLLYGIADLTVAPDVAEA
jgi:hypothetical protein